jgi:hypothetical protein
MELTTRERDGRYTHKCINNESKEEETKPRFGILFYF